MDPNAETQQAAAPAPDTDQTVTEQVEAPATEQLDAFTTGVEEARAAETAEATPVVVPPADPVAAADPAAPVEGEGDHPVACSLPDARLHAGLGELSQDAVVRVGVGSTHRATHYIPRRSGDYAGGGQPRHSAWSEPASKRRRQLKTCAAASFTGATGCSGCPCRRSCASTARWPHRCRR